MVRVKNVAKSVSKGFSDASAEERVIDNALDTVLDEAVLMDMEANGDFLQEEDEQNLEEKNVNELLTGSSGDGVDIVKAYTREVFAKKLLTAEEEKALGMLIFKGNKAEEELAETNASGKVLTARRLAALNKAMEAGKKAQDDMVEANLRLVLRYAGQNTGRGLDYLDLVNEGNLGLMRAAKKFDVNMNYKFSTYAVFWVKQAIARAIAEKSRTIRISVTTNARLIKMKKVASMLALELGYEPSNKELAKKLGVPVEYVESVMKYNRNVVSIDQPINDDGTGKVEDMIADDNAVMPDKAYAVKELSQEIATVFSSFSEMEIDIVRSHFGFDGEIETLEHIGSRYGVTRERIRQIEERVLRKIRKNPTMVSRLLPFYNEAS